MGGGLQQCESTFPASHSFGKTWVIAPLVPALALFLRTPDVSPVVSRNYTKPFFIAGCILGEVYVLLLLLAPKAPGHAGVHWSGALTAILLFGPFGGAAGGGIGLLVSALVSKLKR